MGAYYVVLQNETTLRYSLIQQTNVNGTYNWATYLHKLNHTTVICLRILDFRARLHWLWEHVQNTAQYLT